MLCVASKVCIGQKVKMQLWCKILYRIGRESWIDLSGTLHTTNFILCGHRMRFLCMHLFAFYVSIQTRVHKDHMALLTSLNTSNSKIELMNLNPWICQPIPIYANVLPEEGSGFILNFAIVLVGLFNLSWGRNMERKNTQI